MFFGEKDKYGKFCGQRFFMGNETHEKAEKNLEFRGVQPKPRQFTPIINLGGNEYNMGTDAPNKSAVAATIGQGIGQPLGDTISTTRPMKRK